MPVIVPIEDVGLHGINKDIPTRMLSPGAWTDALNVHFRDGYVEKAPGNRILLTPSVIPYALFPAPYNGINFWTYFGKAKVYGVNGPTEADITNISGDYTGTEYDQWNGGFLNGIPFFNNGVDNPQVWINPSLSTPLVDLSNWPASTTCKILRAYKEFLVALDVTKSSVRDRRLVKWSNPAEPGTLPDSWDETDPENDAGEKSLSEGVDALIDCCPMGEVNVLYLETSTWGMRYSGGTFIFDFYRLFDKSGLLSTDCVCPFRGGHFAVTQDDVVIHDTTKMESIVSGRLRRWLFNNLNSSAYFLTRVVPFYKNQEIWICFPKDSGVLDTALVWNWSTNTWTVLDIPNVRAIASSLYSPSYSFDLWDTGDSLQWDEETDERWGDPSQTRFVETLLFSPESVEGIRTVDENIYTANDVAYRSYVERTGLAYVRITQDGKPVANPTTMKNSVSIWPRIEAEDGVEFSIYLGTQMSGGGDVTWSDPQTFTVGTDVKVDIYATGRLYALRIEATSDDAWKLTGYDLEINEAGIH